MSFRTPDGLPRGASSMVGRALSTGHSNRPAGPWGQGWNGGGGEGGKGGEGGGSPGKAAGRGARRDPQPARHRSPGVPGRGCAVPRP